jgi:hypothetical protein
LYVVCVWRTRQGRAAFKQLPKSPLTVRWLTVNFLDYAISYQGTVLFDFIMRREMNYVVYLFVIAAI